MILYLDFDGTVVEHDHPRIGRPNPYAVDVIHQLQERGWDVILNTYRSDLGGSDLMRALKYLQNTGRLLPITKWTENKIQPPPFNLDKMIEEGRVFIDDISFGIPLIRGSNGHPMVDWRRVALMLGEKGFSINLKNN